MFKKVFECSNSKNLNIIFSRSLFHDDHTYVEIPMIVNGQRGRAWIDDRVNPTIGMLAIGEIAFIEGDGDPALVTESIRKVSMNVHEICCDRRFGDTIKVCFDEVQDKFNIFYRHDGLTRDYKASSQFNIVEIDKFHFSKLNQTGEEWLGSMFTDADDFVNNCNFGFCAMDEDLLVSVSIAFSYDGKRANIGIATRPEFRGLGLSTACSARLIKKLIAHDVEPVWVTGPDNLASQKVAARNGFTEYTRLPIFWTKKE